MSFKNDNQRKAAFANMNKFSIASMVVDSFPGPDIGNVVTGITPRGVAEESNAYKSLKSGSQFSEEEMGDLKQENIPEREEPIKMENPDRHAEEFADSMHNQDADEAEQMEAEAVTEEIYAESESTGGTSEDFDSGFNQSTHNTYNQSTDANYNTDNQAEDINYNINKQAADEENISRSQTFEGYDTVYDGADKRVMEKIVEERTKAIARQAITRATTEQEVGEDMQVPLTDALKTSFKSGNFQDVGVKVNYDKHGNPMDTIVYKDPQGLRGALIHEAADVGKYVGEIPGKVLHGTGAAVVDVVNAPGRAVKSVGSGVGKVGRTVERGVFEVAAPAAVQAAHAFGATSGGAISGVVAGLDDVMMGPQRLYTQERAGVAKTWDPARESYRLDKIPDRTPLAPFAPQLGTGQVPGVKVKPEQYVAAQESFGQSLYGGMSLKDAENAFVDMMSRNRVASPSRSSAVPTSFGTSRSAAVPTIQGASRTTNSALRDRANLEVLKSSLGQNSPRVERAESALQSKVSGLQRSTAPGSFDDSVIKTSGLDRVIR